ncbi:hypothetical protein GCM10007086_19260 [Photobacterium aphoticum]|nr:hypothetical protein GCM10007086_19260 [Photobacterium aphoticum]
MTGAEWNTLSTSAGGTQPILLGTQDFYGTGNGPEHLLRAVFSWVKFIVTHHLAKVGQNG